MPLLSYFRWIVPVVALARRSFGPFFFFFTVYMSAEDPAKCLEADSEHSCFSFLEDSQQPKQLSRGAVAQFMHVTVQNTRDGST